MSTWRELKKELRKVDSEAVNLADIMAYLYVTRLEKNITQTELAERMGVKQPQIARIESMDTTPTYETLSKYAKALGLQLKITAEPIV